MAEPDLRNPIDRPFPGEVVRATFADGVVVQLSPSSPSGVIDVHPAVVVVTTERIVAVHGADEWSWMLDDLEDVHHGDDAPWTILSVPGVPGHGVAVAPAQVGLFRAALAAARGEESIPSASPSVPVEPVEPVVPVVDLAPETTDIVTVADLTGDEGTAPASPPYHAAPQPPPVVESAFDLTEPVLLSELPPPPGAQLPVDPTDAGPSRATRVRGSLRRSSRPSNLEVLPLAGLEAKEISAWFGTHHVLDRVSLDMKAGEVTALIGPSGCGKSTFLRILNRMHEMIASASLSGEVLLDGSDIYDVNRKLTDARRQIGMVFQKPNPFPAMSIYDNVVASFRLTGTKVGSNEKDDVVESCLTKAGLWNEVRDRLRMPGGGLSGGQQQRLCIARALAIRPRVLLMDEPCSALDPTSTRRIEETIMELGSEVTIVIVTHNMQQAHRVSDKCAFFLAEQGTPGVIVEFGPTEAMFGRPRDRRTDDYVNGRFG